MIRALIETSLVDWDGKITTVLFFDQCNLRCIFCQNWELILHPERFAEVSLDKIYKILKAKKNWVDGVVLTGGEPLLFFDEVIEISRKIKRLGMAVKIDTNGTFPDRLKELIKDKIVDYVAMDIKAPLEIFYLAVMGKEDFPSILGGIKKSISILLEGNIDYEFRTTCVPGIIDEGTIEKIGVEIKGARRWVLQRFVPENAYKEELRDKRYSPEELNSLLKKAQYYVPNAKLR
uniref:Anaerobic ribonucleoside-triphosphate reductase activating protein n=1 Tax=candidate division WOR-3 bacterium TaxID=2052148 RepID=A0A7C4XLQ1_UNCW3